jgi:branched-chain amino acid transport system ATP-binding protein
LDPLLSVGGLVAGYTKRQVLKGVSLNVMPGEIVVLIGHNGAGKSTFLKAVFGLIPIWEGRVIVDGQTIKLPNPRKLLSAGVAYVPQGNRVFTELSVRENLEMGGITLPSRSQVDEGIERVFSLFPRLKARVKQRAGTMSGGEKQMLALGNALILSPRILLLDEPSLGLAPPMVSGALRTIQEISKSSGVAVLIVEQKVREVLRIAQRVYVLRNGTVSFSGPTSDLEDERKLRQVYL